MQAVDDPALDRGIRVDDIMIAQADPDPVDLDQEEVALKFQKYALISAAVVDPAGRLVGMITVDDIVHIIQEEAGEDALLLSGAGTATSTSRSSTPTRNASLARRESGDRDRRLDDHPLLRRLDRAAGDPCVLTPIVAGVGGNAGTQTLAVTVRAMATNELTSSKRCGWSAVSWRSRWPMGWSSP